LSGCHERVSCCGGVPDEKENEAWNQPQSYGAEFFGFFWNFVPVEVIQEERGCNYECVEGKNG